MAYAENAASPGQWSGQDEPKRQSQITSGKDRLTVEAERLLKLSSVLSERLEPVMRPDHPRPTAAEPNAAAPDWAPLASGLHEIAARLSHAADRLDAVIERLEV